MCSEHGQSYTMNHIICDCYLVFVKHLQQCSHPCASETRFKVNGKVTTTNSFAITYIYGPRSTDYDHAPAAFRPLHLQTFNAQFCPSSLESNTLLPSGSIANMTSAYPSWSDPRRIGGIVYESNHSPGCICFDSETRRMTYPLKNSSDPRRVGGIDHEFKNLPVCTCFDCGKSLRVVLMIPDSWDFCPSEDSVPEEKPGNDSSPCSDSKTERERTLLESHVHTLIQIGALKNRNPSLYSRLKVPEVWRCVQICPDLPEYLPEPHLAGSWIGGKGYWREGRLAEAEPLADGAWNGYDDTEHETLAERILCELEEARKLEEENNLKKENVEERKRQNKRIVAFSPSAYRVNKTKKKEKEPRQTRSGDESLGEEGVQEKERAKEEEKAKEEERPKEGKPDLRKLLQGLKEKRVNKWRLAFLGQLAGCMAATLELRYPSMGSLVPGTDDQPGQSTEIIPGFYCSDTGELRQRGSVYTAESFESPEAYLRKERSWEMPSPHSSVQRGAEMIASKALKLIPWNSGFLVEDAYGLSEAGADKPFTICHRDLDLHNIILTKEGALKGVVGWGCTETVPMFVACGRYPTWLKQEVEDCFYGWPLTYNEDEWSSQQKEKIEYQRQYSYALATAIAGFRYHRLLAAGLPGHRENGTPADISAHKTYQELYSDAMYSVRCAHVHSWVWEMAQTNTGRYLICTKIIKDCFPLEAVDEVLASYADATIDDSLRRALDIAIDLIMHGRNWLLSHNREKSLDRDYEKWILHSPPWDWGEHIQTVYCQTFPVLKPVPQMNVIKRLQRYNPWLSFTR